MEWGVLIVVLGALFFAFLVLQATAAARHWDRVIAAGDAAALEEALTKAMDSWRDEKAPKGMAAAEWQGLRSVTLMAADRDRCRVALLANPELEIVDHRHEETTTAIEVGRRIAARTVERLLYEIPHVRFREVQVDVHERVATADGSWEPRCVLTTRATREAAAVAPWDEPAAAEVLGAWDTREEVEGEPVDPEDGAVIAAERPGTVLSTESVA